MIKYYKIIFLVILVIAITPSCKKKNDVGSFSLGNFTDTAGTLKEAASFPIGMAIDYSFMKNNAAYRSTVIRETDQVTFGYQMKHGAIVKDDGSFEYSRADELLSISNAAGLEVFGHTLVWHQNQNGNYLRSLLLGGSGSNPVNLLPVGSFESGTGTSGTGSTLFTGWNVLVGGTATGGFAAVAGNASTRALEATVTSPGVNAYDIQAIGSNWTSSVGKQYKVSVDIKASVTGGKVRLVNQNNQYQQFDITPTTSWATYTWTLTALEAAPILRLNFPNAGVYTIDNITIADATVAPPPNATQIATAVDSAMSRFIRNTVQRYAGKVKAWDVVNESISDGTGTVRSNTGITTGDIFYWQQYLGRNYALKAFQYAKAADPNALLFINDYNLESDNTKLDSLIAYIAELKSKGAQIDGIGTQMHINLGTPQSGIETMFQKLAATGLKIRISELDIRVNLNNTTNFTPSAMILAYQAALYKSIVESYIRNVPSSQRYGITIWGVGDGDSWYVTTQNRVEFPLLFDINYQKKDSYSGFLQALKGK